MTANFELFIFLSDTCNFACEHCITHSDSRAKQYLVTKNEIAGLATYINENAGIEVVHFIGGEPSIKLDEISEIQRKLERPVYFKMTTNGWFYRAPERVFSKIKIDHVIISFDRFHEKHISGESLSGLQNYLISKKISVELKVSLLEPSDLLAYQKYLIPGVSLSINKIEPYGKAKEKNLTFPQESDSSIWQSFCPSLREESSGLEGIIYIPSKGLTPCCSGLVFDKNGNENFIYSEISKDYLTTNRLRMDLENGFMSVADQSKICVEGYNPKSRCDACHFLYSRMSYAGLPSKVEMTNISDHEVKSFAIKCKLSSDDLAALKKKYRITYLYVGRVGANPGLESEGKLPEGLTVNIESADIAIGLHALMTDIMRDSKSNLSESEKLDLKPHELAFIRDANALYTYSYLGNKIAALYINSDLYHPLLGRKVCHIGFLGIKSSITSRLIRRAIKLDMKRLILLLSSGREVSGRIAAENFPSIHNAETMGRSAVYLSIKRKI